MNRHCVLSFKYSFAAKKRHAGDTANNLHQKRNKYDPTQLQSVTDLQEYLIEVEQAEKCMYHNVCYYSFKCSKSLRLRYCKKNYALG